MTANLKPSLRARTVTVGLMLMVSLLTGGWFVERGTRTGAVPTRAAATRLFDEVLTHVGRFYVDSLDTPELYRLAVDGMLYELADPYTTILAPERLGRLNETTSGNYAGIGLQADVRDGWMVVIAPTPGSAAERAGIQPGDRIIEVNGRSTHGWTLGEAMKAFRGNAGTTISLMVERPGMGAAIPLKLTRTPLHQSAVRRIAILPNGVGYLDLKAFSDSTEREVTRGIDALLKRGMKSLILDLRSNPGGLLEQGLRVSDLFLGSGQKIVSLRGRTPEANREYTDSSAQRWPRLPITVLVNDRSASAAEIVAGALQDHDRAVIVGESTYGKGSAQTIIPLPNIGALKITTARWFTPSGRSITRAIDRGDDESAEPAQKESDTRYRTDAGRIVYDGGGITPDVIESDSAHVRGTRELQGALGRKVVLFRDALTDYALALKGRREITTQKFVVTQAMLDEVWKRMLARGVEIDRGIYDANVPVVSALLSYDIARYVFGPEAEFRRRVANDQAIKTALMLASGIESQSALIARASEKQKTQRAAENE